MLVYHALPISDWVAFRESGVYRPESLVTQGYVHLSTRVQALRVLNSVFAGRNDVVLLELESTALGEALRWETADLSIGAHETEEEQFPHLYRQVAVDDVSRVWMREAYEEQIEL